MDGNQLEMLSKMVEQKTERTEEKQLARKASIGERALFGHGVEIVSESADACTVYRVPGKTGALVMNGYAVFPGITLLFNDVDTCECTAECAPVSGMLEINHCRSGRFECAIGDEYVYLGPGDLSVSRMGEAQHDSYFPLGHYEGITLLVDTARAPDCLSCILDDVDVRPAALLEKFSPAGGCYVTRSDAHIEHIFSELYDVPESIRTGYFKVKILELLLFLSGMEVSAEVAGKRCWSSAQVQLAKDVCRYLTAHLESQFTIEELSARFHVSPTQLKTSFKGVYGVSVCAYVRAQRMQSAACALRQTDAPILEIAGRCGYDNGSKFAGAFRKLMGASPSAYRNAARNGTL